MDATPELTSFDCEISRDRLLAKLGCQPNVKPSPRLLCRVDQAIKRISREARPVVVHRSYEMNVERGRVKAGSTTRFRSRKLAECLWPCHTLHVFVATLGDRVDRLIGEAMRKRPHYGVVLDAAGSIAAEATVDRFQDGLVQKLARGEALSSRFSPGYCDWPLQEQQKVFSLLPQRPAGTQLSAECLMTPRKSVSGIVGSGPESLAAVMRSQCLSCPLKHCDHRRLE